MKIISHRGNIRGPIPDKENRPSYIDCAIGSGYDVEIDVRYLNGGLWLGHDGAQYKVDHNWLDKRKAYLWIHCKNLRAAMECQKYQHFVILKMILSILPLENYGYMIYIKRLIVM